MKVVGGALERTVCWSKWNPQPKWLLLLLSACRCPLPQAAQDAPAVRHLQPSRCQTFQI